MGAGSNFNGSVMAAVGVAARGHPRMHLLGAGGKGCASTKAQREAVAAKLRDLESRTGRGWDSFWIWVLGSASMMGALSMLRLALMGQIRLGSVAMFTALVAVVIATLERWRRRRNLRISTVRREFLCSMSEAECQAAVDAVDQLDWIWPNESVPYEMKNLVRELKL